jgi:hypothetical protein
MTELHADLRGGVPVHELDDALPGGEISGKYIPAQPGLIRPSRETSVISVINRPAPPSARAV